MNSRSSTILFVAAVTILAIVDQLTPVSVWLYVAVLSLFVALNVYGSIDVTSQFFVKSLFRGTGQNKSIAITFDDGPIPGNTEKVLGILDQYGVKATFFCIGKNVKSNPGLLKDIHQRGHLIGNHSFFHGPLFDLQSAVAMKKELSDTDSVILETMGQRPRFFRPPYGVTNPMLSRAVADSRHVTIGWSLRSLDTVVTDQQTLLNRIKKRLKAGDILLLHDKCEVTVSILPGLLQYIRESGMTVEPLDKMLDEPAYV